MFLRESIQVCVSLGSWSLVGPPQKLLLPGRDRKCVAPGSFSPLCLPWIELVIGIAYGWDFKSFGDSGKKGPLKGIVIVI